MSFYLTDYLIYLRSRVELNIPLISQHVVTVSTDKSPWACLTDPLLPILAPTLLPQWAPMFIHAAPHTLQEHTHTYFSSVLYTYILIYLLCIIMF